MMKSQDLAPLNLLTPMLPTNSFTNSRSHFAYCSLPAQQLIQSLDFLINPMLFSSLLPAFSKQLQSGLLFHLLHSPLSPQQSSGSLPRLFEPNSERYSQSSESPQVTESAPSSPRISSPARVSSAESCSTKIRRGRPQQDISDDDDPSSQKRRHRRLYARQYRAQMRQKVDEVKVLSAKLEEMQRLVEKLEAALDSERREHQHKTTLLNSMIQSKLLP